MEPHCHHQFCDFSRENVPMGIDDTEELYECPFEFPSSAELQTKKVMRTLSGHKECDEVKYKKSMPFE